jgi:hypothetical protein
MSKKIALMMVILFILSCFGVYASNKAYNETDVKAEIKDKRDKFYLQIKDKFNFNDADIKAFRQKGYSPYFSFVMLSIAQKANATAADIIKLRDEGNSWDEMCTALKIDYPKLMAEVEKNIKANKIQFPTATKSEGKADSAPLKKK